MAIEAEYIKQIEVRALEMLEYDLFRVIPLDFVELIQTFNILGDSE